MRFIHIRRYDAKGQLLATGGVTFGVEEGDNDRLIITKARCSFKDAFCRRVGRMICEGRMKKKGRSSMYLIHKSTFPQFIERVAKRLRSPYPEKSVSFIMEPRKLKHE